MIHSSIQIANFILDKYGKTNDINHLKLQKLVYFCYARWFSDGESVPLTVDPPEMWQFGPVFSSLYSLYRDTHNEPIKEIRFTSVNGNLSELRDEEIYIIDLVWKNYGKYTDKELSSIAHKEKSPWKIMSEVYNCKIPTHTPIPDFLFRKGSYI